MSEADTVDNWGATRKFTPSAPSERSGGGFRDRAPPGGISDGPSRADEGDWGARRAPPPAEPVGTSGRRTYGFSGDAPPPLSAADTEERWSQRGQAPAAASGAADGTAAVSAERPRLKLAPRTKPIDNPPPAAANGSAPPATPSTPGSDAGSSCSGQQQQQQQAPKNRSNPFGAARPREEVLAEKGIDYHKEQLKLEHGEVIRWVTA